MSFNGLPKRFAGQKFCGKRRHNEAKFAFVLTKALKRSLWRRGGAVLRAVASNGANAAGLVGAVGSAIAIVSFAQLCQTV